MAKPPSQNELVKEKSQESLNDLVAEFNSKQTVKDKSNKNDYWGDFDALNNTD